MEALRAHDIAEGGDGQMESALTDIEGVVGRDVKEVYVGPSALWIARLIPRRVSFDGGWFWTTAFCHSRKAGGLAFRQRADGEGIEARCHTGGCSPELAADALGGQIGWPIRSAYEPLAEPVDRLWWLKDWPRWRIEWHAVAALAFAAPLLLGHAMQAAILACLAFSVGSWLTSRSMLRRRSGRFHR